jgi:cell division protein FtsI/penicillin-binding protein 2
MAPIDAPRVVIAVVLDGPVEDASGGRGAAPIFAEVMLAALHQLGISPDA